MSLFETFKAAGIHLAYDASTSAPQIPHVQDVLYALRLSEKHVAYHIVTVRQATYLNNVFLVATAIVSDVGSMRTMPLLELKSVVARAILILSPAEANMTIGFEETQRLAEKISGT